MDEKKLKSDEYEKQYYGFSSTDFYEDFKEQVCKSIKMALKELDTALKEQQYDEVLRDQIIEIYSLYMKNAQAALERAKEEAAKIFAIPNNVVLDEDKYSINQYSDEDVIQLKKEVAELEKEFMRERVFLAKCKQQKDIIETIIKPLHEKVNDIIKSLKKIT
ncbi:hypothetical protein NQ315_004119 [Exocentrus adspersus]|uniref:Uncharacterized protein n=1 Tax=Exocentrus adspersus TaxID=1586481 RepID=A0AAV8W727_9CUCU|nr:hypothetical protein NQ315_004119 [Exocentrus adspersus]